VTAGELIDKLSVMPRDARIIYNDEGQWTGAEEVELREHVDHWVGLAIKDVGPVVVLS
jgi:hypothetical protein